MPDALVSWDSCIIIDAIQKTADRWPSIAPMLNLARNGDLKIVMSTICVAEAHFLRDFARQGMSQLEQNEAIERWLEHSYLVKRAADFGTCKIAAEICRQARLTPPDAIIVATALRHQTPSLITYDDKRGESLLKQDQRFELTGNRRLRICTPESWNKINTSDIFVA